MLDAGPQVDFQRDRVLKAVYELPYRGFGKPGKLPHVLQANEFNANQWVDEQQVPYTHDPKEPYNWVRVRMIGGKSNFWARMSFRLSDYEFKGKDHDGFGENWPISHADLAPFYSRVEPIFRVSGRKEGLAQLPDGEFVRGQIARQRGGEQASRRTASRMGITVTKIRRALGNGQLASSFNLLLPDAMATGNLTLVPNAVVREITVDKNTGLVERRELRSTGIPGAKCTSSAKCVVVGASCLESTRILLNSGIANSSGVLGPLSARPVLHHRTAWSRSSRKRKDGGARASAAAATFPRFRNLKKGEKRDYIRGYAFDFSTGSTPDPKYFPRLGRGAAESSSTSVRGAGFSGDHDGRGAAALREPRQHQQEREGRVGHSRRCTSSASTATTNSTWRRMPWTRWPRSAITPAGRSCTRTTRCSRRATASTSWAPAAWATTRRTAC